MTICEGNWYHIQRATVAQLVEQTIRNRPVEGSNPSGGFLSYTAMKRMLKTNKLSMEGFLLMHKEKMSVLLKILAVTGVILVWLPILAPVFLAAVSMIGEGIFRFDFLIPAELFPFILAGGGLLFTASRSSPEAHSRRKLIGFSLGLAVLLLAGSQLLAEATGIASGEHEPTGLWWNLILTTFAFFWLAIIATGVGGVLLLRDLFKPQRLLTENR